MGTTLDEWADDLDHSTRKTRSLRRWVIGIVAFPYILSALSLNFVGLFLGLIEIMIFLILFRQTMRPGDYNKTVPLPSSLSALRDDVFRLGAELDVDADCIEPRLHPSDLGVSPSIRPVKSPFFRKSRQTYLHVPVGFVGIYAKRPDEGRAIIAHEVAHVRQRDWQLWAALSAFLTITKWVVLPLTAISLISAVAAVVDATILTAKIESGATSGLDYEGPIQELEPSPYETMGWAQSESAKLEEARQSVWTNYLFAALMLLFAPVRLFLAWRISRRRAASEFLADRASAIVTSPQALVNAVRRLESRPRRFAFLSSHISTKRRIRQIVDMFKTPAGETDATAARHSIGEGRFKALLRLTGGSAFHRFFGWESREVDWGRLTAVTLAILITAPISFFVRLLENTELLEYWTLEASTIFGAVPYRASMVACILLGFVISRRDDVSILAAFSLYSILYHYFLWEPPSDVPGPTWPRALSLAFGWAIFFVPLAAALNKGLSIGKAAIVALMISTLYAFCYALADSDNWTSDYGPYFYKIVNDSVSHDMVLVLMLLLGNALGRRTSRLRLRTRHLQLGPA